MKHQKFVKQLMAMGYDRNTAAARAAMYAHMGKSYEDALAYEKAIACGCSEFGAMLERIAEAMRPAVNAAVEAIRRVVESISAIDWTGLAENAEKQLAEAGEQHRACNMLDGLSADYFLVDELDGQGGGGDE